MSTPESPLNALDALLTPGQVLATARLLDATRATTEPLALSWQSAPESLTTTPFMLQVALASRHAGIVTADPLERTSLPVPAAWHLPAAAPRPPLTLSELPTIDCSIAVPATPPAFPKAFTHAAARTLFGFAWWPTLSEWELFSIIRLSSSLATIMADWFAELGRLDEAGLDLDFAHLSPRDHARYAALVADATDPAIRAERLAHPASELIAQNAIDLIRYEFSAFIEATSGGDLLEPRGPYLPLGFCADHAKAQLPRLRSRPFAAYAEACLTPVDDFAPTAAAFADRTAHVLVTLLKPPLTPPAPPALCASRRARRVLHDLAARLIQLYAHTEAPSIALAALADGLATLTTSSSTPPDPDGVIATALDALAGALPPSSAAALFGLGYCPTLDPALEPDPSRDARAHALVRRGYALHPAFGAAFEGIFPVMRRAVAAPAHPASADLVARLLPHGEAAATAGEVPWLAYAYLGWLRVVLSEAPPPSPTDAATRWHYRLAHRTLPADRTTWSEFEVAWNPYLKRFPLPFDAAWADDLARTQPGHAPTFKGKHAHAIWYCYLGTGRDAPVYLPLIPRLSALISALKAPQRLDVLASHPDFGAEFLGRAIADEAVLLVHRPPRTRRPRPIDVFEVASELDLVAETSSEDDSAWDDPAQAEAYEAFCLTSDHYHASSNALCETVGIPPTARVAELGFGSGVTTQAILARLGPTGSLTAADPSALMLARTAARLADPRLTLERGSVRALAWAAAIDGPFDRILANASIWLTSSIASALTVLGRASAPNGRLGLAIPAELLGHLDHLRAPGAQAVGEALIRLRAELALAPPAPQAPPDPALANPEAFAAALEAAGWRDVAFTRFEHVWPASDYIAWMSMPVVADHLVAPADRARAPELMAALAAAVDGTRPALAAWVLITASWPGSSPTTPSFPH